MVTRVSSCFSTGSVVGAQWLWSREVGGREWAARWLWVRGMSMSSIRCRLVCKEMALWVVVGGVLILERLAWAWGVKREADRLFGLMN